MKRLGAHYDNWSFEEEAIFKKDKGFSARRARALCKIIARAEKRSEKLKSGIKGFDEQAN